MKIKIIGDIKQVARDVKKKCDTIKNLAGEEITHQESGLMRYRRRDGQLFDSGDEAIWTVQNPKVADSLDSLDQTFRDA